MKDGGHMEKEMFRMSISEILKEIKNGYTCCIPLYRYKFLEKLKTMAYPTLGPLYIGVDMKRECYMVKLDRNQLWKKNPDLWY